MLRPAAAPAPDATHTDTDVLIIGAGLSGIGAAYHLQARCPGWRYLILEGRAASGGTWDLFRYPGIRSDSDMHTLGYRFKPWRQAQAIADGPSILRYMRETAAENGIEPHIRYGQRAVQADWSSATARWGRHGPHDRRRHALLQRPRAARLHGLLRPRSA